MNRLEGNGRTILVVDDDLAIRVLLSTVLRRLGFEVELAEDGEAALARLAERDYPLLLLDLMMPKMSGFDVLANLNEKTGHRPHIIVFTAAGPTSVDRIPVDSVCATIHKPFDMTTFLETVSACLEQAHELPEVGHS